METEDTAPATDIQASTTWIWPATKLSALPVPASVCFEIQATRATSWHM
jgi:hypothetical protein